MSQLKIKNGNNWESVPAGGIGVPSGGTTGQVLQKSSNTDYATEWADLPQVIENLSPSAIKKIGFSEDISLFSNPDHGRLFAIEIHLTDSATTSTGYKIFQCVVCKNKIQLFGQKTDSSWTTFGTIT